MRAAQCGQEHPDQRPGGRKSGHRFQQAPDHAQPHYRHREPGGHPVCADGHPGLSQAPHAPGGLHGERGKGERGGRGLRAAAGGAGGGHRTPGGRASFPHPSEWGAGHPGHQQDRHRGQDPAAGGHGPLFPGL